MHIILMRHAEKPFTGNSLSEAGHMRATLLPSCFKTNKTLVGLGSPAALYAIAPVTEGRSIRSIQTLLPLANDFNLTINQKYTKYELEKLVDAIKSENQFTAGTIIICCNRGSIPLMARLFGINNAPEIWSNDVYNKLWILNYKDNSDDGIIELSLNILPSDT